MTAAPPQEVVSTAHPPVLPWACCVCGVEDDSVNRVRARPCPHHVLHSGEDVVLSHPVCWACLDAYGLLNGAWLVACPESSEAAAAFALMGGGG